jgi:FkbM family methyltransferase
VSGLGAHVGELLARREVDVVADVGAHLGQFGRLVRSEGYAGRIVSFEPVLAVYAALVKGCTAADPAWEAHRLALGSADETRTIGVARSTDFSSFRAPNERSLAEFAGYSAVEREEAVPVRRLDTVAADYGLDDPELRIFLKLDTQGWDLDVLRGADATLARVVAVQTELPVQALYEGLPSAEEVLAHLEALGFAETARFPVTHDADGRPLEVDCIMERHAG